MEKSPIFCILVAFLVQISAQTEGEFETTTTTTVQRQSTYTDSDRECRGPGGELESRNRKIVLGFMQEVLGNGDIDAADKYVSATTYIQHNPEVEDGREAMKKYLREKLEGKRRERLDVRRVAAIGDHVWTHWRANGTKPIAVVDIFRVDKESGRIVEHWDVYTEIPENTVSKHPFF